MYVLDLGNVNYFSWSMRAWLALRLAGAEFREVIFPRGEPGVREWREAAASEPWVEARYDL